MPPLSSSVQFVAFVLLWISLLQQIQSQNIIMTQPSIEQLQSAGLMNNADAFTFNNMPAFLPATQNQINNNYNTQNSDTQVANDGVGKTVGFMIRLFRLRRNIAIRGNNQLSKFYTSWASTLYNDFPDKQTMIYHPSDFGMTPSEKGTTFWDIYDVIQRAGPDEEVFEYAETNYPKCLDSKFAKRKGRARGGITFIPPRGRGSVRGRDKIRLDKEEKLMHGLFEQYIILCQGLYRRKNIKQDFENYRIELTQLEIPRTILSKIKLETTHITFLNTKVNLPKNPVWRDEIKQFLNYRITNEKYKQKMKMQLHQQQQKQENDDNDDKMHIDS